MCQAPGSKGWRKGRDLFFGQLPVAPVVARGSSHSFADAGYLMPVHTHATIIMH
jgi:hypothetical protein